MAEDRKDDPGRGEDAVAPTDRLPAASEAEEETSKQSEKLEELEGRIEKAAEDVRRTGRQGS